MVVLGGDCPREWEMSGRSVVLLHGELIDQMTDWQRHCPSVCLSVHVPCGPLGRLSPPAPAAPRSRAQPSLVLSRLLIGAKYNRL